MPTSETINIARRVHAIYNDRLRTSLEVTNPNDFVAIEPESSDFYLGKTLSEAIHAARASHPVRLSFTLRIGHTTTIELC